MEKSLSFFDLCYRYLILYDNDRLKPHIKKCFYHKLKKALLFTNKMEALRHVENFQQAICRRETVKNIILFMYENIQKNGKSSPFYNDFEKSKDIDSFVRLIYNPSRHLEAQEQHDCLSSSL
jgi:hypothetical protein